MLTNDDITFNRRAFPIGRLCIFTDADKPCATMLVVVLQPVGLDSDKVPLYKCEYIRASRSVGRLEQCRATDLTPIEHFGFTASFDARSGILRLTTCEGRVRVQATYKNGDERKWQGLQAVGVHPDVVETLDDLYGV